MWRRCVVSIGLAMLQAGAAAQVRELRCHESDRFRVVERPASHEPGADFLVRPVPPSGSEAPCRWDPGPGDFVIARRDAERYLALEGALLVLDNGTGPDGRQLIVWDLAERRRVLDVPYGGLVSMQHGEIVYWHPTGTPPTPQNCPQLEQWRAQLLGAAIEVQVRFRSADGRATILPTQRCAPRQ
jgi:hypothetical protein